jgi:hypothetical protein
MSVEEYARCVCALLDVPVYGSVVQSLYKVRRVTWGGGGDSACLLAGWPTRRPASRRAWSRGRAQVFTTFNEFKSNPHFANLASLVAANALPTAPAALAAATTAAATATIGSTVLSGAGMMASAGAGGTLAGGGGAVASIRIG